MSALRAGEYLPPAEDLDSYDPQADMRSLQKTHKKKQVETESYLSKEQLLELRRVQNERIEVGIPFVNVGDQMLRFYFSGRSNEITGNGREADNGCSYGWDNVRRMKREL
jgi:hypothetical protein